jgi:hypothetical protein
MLAFLEEASSAERARIEAKAEKAGDPLNRLRVLVMTPLRSAGKSVDGSLAMIITKESRHLRDLFPGEIAAMSAPYVKLLQQAITDAAEAGFILPEDPELDAELIMELVSGAFTDAYLGRSRSYSQHLESYLWRFCLRALGVSPATLAGLPPDQ